MPISTKDKEFMGKVAAFFRSTISDSEPNGSIKRTAEEFNINRHVKRTAEEFNINRHVIRFVRS